MIGKGNILKQDIDGNKLNNVFSEHVNGLLFITKKMKLKI
jgi:hypothetical protein